MNNTLIDNSTAQISMLYTLKKCLALQDICTVKIATGYWDLPGLALLTDDIKAFLEKEGTKFLLIIGKDPYVYASQVKNPKYKDKNYPVDFIRTDLCELEPKEAFENAVRLLLDFCTEGEDAKIQAFADWLTANYETGIHGDPCNWKEFKRDKYEVYEDEEDK